jgi:predicted Zn-dependent protease
MKAIACVLMLGLAAAFAQPASPFAETPTPADIESALKDVDAKQFDQALTKLVVLEKAHPNDPLVLNLIGACHVKKKDYAKAEPYFQKALENSPGFFPALYNLGEVMFLKKDFAAARGHFQSMRASDKRNELLQFKVVLCDLELGENDRAKKVMNAIKYPGDSPAWYYAQAAWELKNGKRAKAREYIAGARYIFGDKTALFDESFADLGYNP